MILDLSHNQLTALPDDLANLTSLEKFVSFILFCFNLIFPLIEMYRISLWILLIAQLCESCTTITKYLLLKAGIFPNCEF